MPFTGRATYSNFTAIAEDVSDLVSMISPRETPLLDILGDAPFPARNVLHEWIEDDLSPNSIATASNVASDTAQTSFGVANSKAARLQPGMVLRAPNGEYMVVEARNLPNTITVSRAFGGTTATSLGTGQLLDVISDAGFEGADVEVDTSGVRARKNNFVQLYKKDVINWINLN